MTEFRSEAWHVGAARARFDLYRALLGRDPDADGDGAYAYRQTELGWTKEDVEADIKRSQEYRDTHPETGLRGFLRLGEGDRAFEDDDGPVLPVFCHAGDLFSLFWRDAARAQAELDAIAAAGYHGIRTWTVLRGEYWQNFGRVIVPDEGPYWEAIAGFADALRRRNLRWLVSQGDLMAHYLTTDGRTSFMRDLAVELRDAGGLGLVAGVDGGNETWQNGEPDFLKLGLAVDAFLEELDVPVFSLTSPQGEEPAELNRYAGSVYDVHGYRGGHAWDKIRHAFSIAYEGRPEKRLGIQSEPPGPGALVSVTEHQEELDAEAMALLSAMHLMARQATVFFSSPGVSVRERGEFARQPGFAEVPRLARQLPRDLMTFSTLCHGWDRWRGTRVFAVAVGAEARCDHALADDGRVVCLIYGPPGSYRIPVERGFEGVVLDGLGGSVDVSCPAGSTLGLEFSRGRVLVGRLT